MGLFILKGPLIYKIISNRKQMLVNFKKGQNGIVIKALLKEYEILISGLLA